MPRVYFTRIVVWLLVLAQVVVIGLESVRTVVCREADGSLHVEVGVSGCCGGGATATIFQAGSTAGGSSRLCEGEGCADEIVTEPRMSHVRADVVGSTRDASRAITARAVGILCPASERPAGSRGTAEGGGQPRLSRYAVRSVVLRL